MTNAVSPDSLHGALCATYVDPHPGLAPVTDLATLARAAAEPKRRLLVALALWNVLGRKLADPPPTGLAGLVRDVLGLDLEDARRERRRRALPPFLELEVVDATCKPLKEREGRTRGGVELCVLTHFDDLVSAAHPTAWLARCDLFWQGLHDAPLPGGVLQLPHGAPLRVSLDVGMRHGSLRKEIDIKIHIGGGHLASSRTILEKERGRPGATRIRHRRSVDFRGRVPPAQRAATLAYWLQTEAVCLAIR
jgi:hypothetical protein